MAAWHGNECNDGDEGTVTVIGVALIIAVGVLLTVLAAGATIMLCQSRARTAADLSAIAGAQAMVDGHSAASACSVANLTAQTNGANPVSCVEENGDVQIRVSVDTAVPLLAQVEAESRAGPVTCDD